VGLFCVGSQLWKLQFGLVGGDHGFTIGTIHGDGVVSGAKVGNRMVDGEIDIRGAGVCH
jgi:hypothetical protein